MRSLYCWLCSPQVIRRWIFASQHVQNKDLNPKWFFFVRSAFTLKVQRLCGRIICMCLCIVGAVYRWTSIVWAPMHEYLWIDCVHGIHTPSAWNFGTWFDSTHEMMSLWLVMYSHKWARKKWNEFWYCIVAGFVAFHVPMDFVPHEEKTPLDLTNREHWILNMAWRVRSVLKHTSRSWNRSLNSNKLKEQPECVLLCVVCIKH